ncbi:MAG: hypothetical protein ACTSQM_04760 [Candidatus Odinarchaeia archaeon]
MSTPTGRNTGRHGRNTRLESGGIHEHEHVDMMINGLPTPVQLFTFYNESQQVNITVGYSEKTGALIYINYTLPLSSLQTVEMTLTDGNFNYAYTSASLQTSAEQTGISVYTGEKFTLNLTITNVGELNATNAVVNWSSTVFTGDNNIQVNVSSGETVQVSLTLTAPQQTGLYSLTVKVYFNGIEHDSQTYSIDVNAASIPVTVIAIGGGIGAAVIAIAVVLAIFRRRP